MEPALEGQPREHVIKRSQHLGYGFVAGEESPTMVKSVERNGPSYKRLLPGDVIMAVNGIDVEHATREQIIKMIQLSNDQIRIKVRQPTYEDLIRAKNLSNPKFYTLNKSTSHHHPPPLPPLTTNGRLPTSIPLNQSPLNRLVTSISQQQQQLLQHSSSNSPFSCADGETPPVQIKPASKPMVLQQHKPDNGFNLINNIAKTENETKHKCPETSYGRHSPIPQRCKSSIDAVARNGGKSSNKKSNDNDNELPLLKRSNTMRPMKAPIKPPPKVMKIFEVVIKVFFEIGHYRTLTYNQDTTVSMILESLNARLVRDSKYSEIIKRYFGLALTIGVNSGVNTKEQLPKRKLLHILDENDSIMKIRQLPYATKLRLLYRMVYPPTDVSTLYTQDKVAFDYLYHQSCNDLKLERFSPELDQETALKLSALHLLEYVHSNNAKLLGDSKDPKVYVKLIKKTPGIEFFVPASMAETMVDKKGKRIVCQYKKMRAKMLEQLRKNFEEFDFEPSKVRSTTNLDRYSSTSFHELSLPEMTTSPSDCIKLLFLNYLSQLPCYGNSKRPVRTSTSPMEGNSGAECSSSLESVTRASDSSPLIRADRNQNSHHIMENSHRLDNVPSSLSNNVTRQVHINSMRSLNAHYLSLNGHHHIQQLEHASDIVQTPESVSSVTLNTQSSPSPQQPLSSYVPQQQENYPTLTRASVNLEPSPRPRQQIATSRPQDFISSTERLFSQRYNYNEKPIEELLKEAIIPPLPPLPPLNPPMLEDSFAAELSNRKYDIKSISHLTQVLTDKDIERLRVPPPPRISN